MRLVIGNRNYSSWSFRPWIAMRHAGIDFETQVVPLDFTVDNVHLLEHSPSKRVPVLYDGDLCIWESLAICEYVAERFPEAGLWPQNPAMRARARSISCEMHAGFSALRNSLHMNMHRKPAALAYHEGTAKDIARIEQIWADCRAETGQGGPFLFGAFTIADAMFAPVVSRFHSYQVPVSLVSKAYMEAMAALPAWREWEAEALTEDWVIPGSEV